MINVCYTVESVLVRRRMFAAVQVRIASSQCNVEGVALLECISVGLHVVLFFSRSRVFYLSAKRCCVRSWNAVHTVAVGGEMRPLFSSYDDGLDTHFGELLIGRRCYRQQ